MKGFRGNSTVSQEGENIRTETATVLKGFRLQPGANWNGPLSFFSAEETQVKVSHLSFNCAIALVNLRTLMNDQVLPGGTLKDGKQTEGQCLVITVETHRGDVTHDEHQVGQ